MSSTLKIFHCADLHLGLKFARYPADVADKLREARFTSLERMVARANAEGCELFVVAGDLFDTLKVAARDVARAAKILAGFDRVVALLPGNHDFHAGTADEFWRDFPLPGGSGENYLRGEMATLKRTNSIGVMPYRANSRDYSTSMGTYVSRADKAIGAAAPLVMAAHSYGGKFALRSLKADPSVMKRVKSFFFLDAQYDIDEIMFPVITELFTSQGAKPIHAVSVTTGDNTAALKKLMDANFPGKMTVSTGSGDHCHAPQYFSQL
jgi:hypothetical protein